MSFVIGVVAYRRPKSLMRLLRSLEMAARNANNVPPIFFFLDGGAADGCKEVAAIVEAFEWPGGSHIHRQDERIGLVGNVLSCTDLALTHEAVLVLEEDVCVGPGALNYAAAALEAYGDVPEIAQISLYGFVSNELVNIPFEPLDDGGDVYFAQTGSSHGHLFTRGQWQAYRAWQTGPESDAPLPEFVLSWSIETSWKRQFNRYLSATSRYCVFPRHSFATNMGDEGEHYAWNKSHMTSPLSLGQGPWRFPVLAQSLARYDAFLELEPTSLKALVPDLSNFDLAVDLTGARTPEQITSEYVLSGRGRRGKALINFGLRHYPPELNIVFGEPGMTLGLYRRADLNFGRTEAIRRIYRRFYRMS